jgi:hypothetical protein
MMMRRTMSAIAAAILGGLLASVPAHADTAISRPFMADSGDACRYGVTQGTLNWLFGPSTSPLPVTAVDVRGTLIDHPTPADPASACRSDGFASTATFTGFSGSAAVARQQVRADNAIVQFQFRLAPSTTDQHLDRVVIQVCRGPVVTLPPSYCGTAVTYLPPPIG